MSNKLPAISQTLTLTNSHLKPSYAVKSQLSISLFGKLCIQRNGHEMVEIPCGKLQELFGYLALRRPAPQTRETLATLLWENYPDAQSKKCLRQALWQLQVKLNSISDPDHLLLIDSEWVRINPNPVIQVDVEEFEKAFASVRGIPGQDLSREQALTLAQTVALHQGSLLEGCYRDWCLCERERLLDMNLAMLDKLIRYCETQGEYEQGLSYGESVLRYDYAHERTHRAMMRLRYDSGDRTGALRQYQRCVEALRRELGVGPSSSTKKLYEQIREDAGQVRTQSYKKDVSQGYKRRLRDDR